MLAEFEKHIKSKNLFQKKSKLLVAMSGGVDSVVLTQLLHSLNYNIAIAHCNFKLRAKDSDRDEAFCKNVAQNLDIKIHSKAFDVNAYCKKHKLSIQMAARDLRYNWFEELMNENGYDYLITAHHADDSAETILLNLVRGSGLKGLTGIHDFKEKVIRPLLPFKKQEILDFAKANGIKFRNDKSNAEDKYKRNFIRLNIIPQLKKLNPSFEETLLKNAEHIQNDLDVLNEFIDLKRKELLVSNKNEMTIVTQQLLLQNNLLAITKHLLLPFGFNTTQVENLIFNLKSKGIRGKEFRSATHTLYIADKQLVIQAKKVYKNEEFIFENYDSLKRYPLFTVEESVAFKIPKQNELLIDKSKLIFPLVLRNKKTGDKFKPFGMKGFKLLSDFYKEQKLNPIQKQNTVLLVNGNKEIIWIVGLRSDERYRVNVPSNNILKISYSEQ